MIDSVRPVRAVLSTMVVLLLAGIATAQPPGRVTGIVRDESDQPLKGATVNAQNENVGGSYTATTDEKGRFVIIGLRPGEWTFIVQSPGFAPDGGRMNVRAASNLNPPMMFHLKRNGPGAGGALERFSGKDLQLQLTNAESLFNQGKYDESISAYRSLMSSAAPLSFLNLQVAAAYLAKNDLPKASASYEELLKSDPSNQKAIVGIAEVRLKQGDAKAAEEMLRRAAQGEDAGREVLLSLGDVVAGAGHDDEAAEWFRKASGADPYWGKPLYRLARIAAAKGDTTASNSYMEKVIAVDPSSPEAAHARTALGR
jgi:predicted Zn-dependent protease